MSDRVQPLGREGLSGDSDWYLCLEGKGTELVEEMQLTQQYGLREPLGWNLSCDPHQASLSAHWGTGSESSLDFKFVLRGEQWR